MLRFLLNLLAPPAIATGLMAGALWIARDQQPHPGLVLIALLYAYLFAGIPCIIHACVLAYAYRRNWSPRSGRTLVLSTLNGLLAGVALDCQFANQFTVGIFAKLGAATGAFTGLLQFLIRDKPARQS